MKMMDAKLTLKLDRGVIHAAKEAAQRRGESLSRMVERFFRALAGSKSPSKRPSFSPAVSELIGLVKLPKNFDAKQAYGAHLLKKYSR